MSRLERRKIIQAVRLVHRAQTERVSFTLIDPRERIFELTRSAELWLADSLVRFPEGERWNLASIPRPVWWIIAPHELGAESTLGHDKLYEYKGALPREWFLTPYRTFTRAESDQIMEDLALSSKAREWQAELAHRTLRLTWSIPDALGITTWRN